MNYQLLIESYSFGANLTNQEIDLLIIELDTQIMNLKVSLEIDCLKPAPKQICERLKLKEKSLWITCLAEIIDIHKPVLSKKARSVKIYELLLSHGLLID